MENDRRQAAVFGSGFWRRLLAAAFGGGFFSDGFFGGNFFSGGFSATALYHPKRHILRTFPLHPFPQRIEVFEPIG